MGAIFPIILSGGSGTRLWPLSRAKFPKQFIDLHYGGGQSLLAATLARLGPESGFAQPTILCNEDHRFLVRDDTARVGILPKAIILEPVARNTAPAIAVAALAALREDEDAILVVMPSDHVVEDAAQFAASVRRAADVARAGKLVLFGIVADVPHTGYGYIRQGEALPGFAGAYAVDAFFEKPDLDTARSYISQGGHYWNSGIFVLHARTFCDELERLAPAILDAARRALEKAAADGEFFRLEPEAFASSPSISVDYAVMEKTKAAAMLPLDVGWNDVGSWSALWDIAPKDAAQNAVRGTAVLEGVHGCYIHSEKPLVAAIGVSDLVIVDTPDALLVADKSRAQEVSKIVARLKEARRPEQTEHVRRHGPWGFEEALGRGERYQTRLLHVNPGGTLTLTLERSSFEHWVVVGGSAKLVIEGAERLIAEGESVHIAPDQNIRLENAGPEPLELIAVRTGEVHGGGGANDSPR